MTQELLRKACEGEERRCEHENIFRDQARHHHGGREKKRLESYREAEMDDKERKNIPDTIFRCVHASLYEGLSVGRSVRPSVRRSVTRFFLIAEIEKKQHRIIRKVETFFLDCNNLQKQNFKTKF